MAKSKTKRQLVVVPEFGDRLGQERREMGVRLRRDVEQQEIAKALGVSASTVGRWELGRVPRNPMLDRLAAFFGVIPAWLRYGAGPRYAPIDAEASQGEAPRVQQIEAGEEEPSAVKGEGAAKKSPTARVAGARGRRGR